MFDAVPDNAGSDQVINGINQKNAGNQNRYELQKKQIVGNKRYYGTQEIIYETHY
jgi:hypothetical protein